MRHHGPAGGRRAAQHADHAQAVLPVLDNVCVDGSLPVLLRAVAVPVGLCPVAVLRVCHHQHSQCNNLHGIKVLAAAAAGDGSVCVSVDERHMCSLDVCLCVVLCMIVCVCVCVVCV